MRYLFLTLKSLVQAKDIKRLKFMILACVSNVAILFTKLVFELIQSIDTYFKIIVCFWHSLALNNIMFLRAIVFKVLENMRRWTEQTIRKLTLNNVNGGRGFSLNTNANVDRTRTYVLGWILGWIQNLRTNNIRL